MKSITDCAGYMVQVGVGVVVDGSRGHGLNLIVVATVRRRWNGACCEILDVCDSLKRERSDRTSTVKFGRRRRSYHDIFEAVKHHVLAIGCDGISRNRIKGNTNAQGDIVSRIELYHTQQNIHALSNRRP